MTVRRLEPGQHVAEGETELKLLNTTADTLHIGILKGEYLRVLPGGVDPTVFALTADQKGRYDLQLRAQPIYQGWFAAGYLVDVTNAPPPPPPPEGD
jgi:hypothetical protein